MFTSTSSRAVLLTTLLLSACGKSADSPKVSSQNSPSQANANAVRPAPLASTVSADEAIAFSQTLELNSDTQDLLQLASWGSITPVEQSAVSTAKEKMALTKGAKAVAEQNKKIALDAKAAYSNKLQVYQQSLAEAEASRKSRGRAMAALAAAQAELDSAWNAVNNAREAYNKSIVEPSSTAAQKAAAEAMLAKANGRAEQAAALVETRTTELQASQQSNQALLMSSVTSAAQATTIAGNEYATKVATAARSVEAFNAAVAEEKKSLAVIYALNKARAKVVAETLANAAYSLTKAHSATESARDAARSAESAKQSATSRLSAATRDAANTKLAAAKAAEAASFAATVAQEKARSKESADALAAELQKTYSVAKAAQDLALSASSKSASEAKQAAKTLSDANAKAALASKALDAAVQANLTKDDAETQKALADAKAAAALATEAQRVAQETNNSAMARSAGDAAVAAQAKTDADAKLVAYRQVAAAASTAAKEKAAADNTAVVSGKNSASAAAQASSAAINAERATASSEAANRASAAANEKLSAATQAEANARSHYNTVYSQSESYRLSATKTETEQNSDEQKLFAAALWAKVPEGNYWTSLVMASVRKNLSSLERARDLNEWCPGYFEATEHQRDVCWLRLMGGLVKFESSFKPDDKFKEPSGNWSVGLMALSPKECKGYETIDLLQQPLLNLSCGIGKFADLIERDGYIAGPEKALGAAAYWSTLRGPYKQKKPDGSGYYNLGKKNEILPFTTVYRNF